MATAALYDITTASNLLLLNDDNDDGDDDFSISTFFSRNWFVDPQQPKTAYLNTLLLHHQRLLQSGNGSDTRGRTVLTVLYLIVLGLCFVVPIFYYFRLHCEERHARRLREMEMIDFAALFANAATHNNNNINNNNNNNNNSSEEVHQTRAIRKKYREERRARILQLLQPVRVVLTTAHFPPQTSSNLARIGKSKTDQEDQNDDVEAAKQNVSPTSSQQQLQQQPPITGEYPLADDDDEGTSFIELPPPGLPSNATTSDGLTTITDTDASSSAMDDAASPTTETRLVPSVCAICISHYQVGEDVVWSSNPSCEHAFHFTCVERWLSKQRDGPLCPCCRREFVIDPFDLQEEDEEDDNDQNPDESQVDANSQNEGDDAALMESGLLRNPPLHDQPPDREMSTSLSYIPPPPQMMLDDNATFVNVEEQNDPTTAFTETAPSLSSPMSASTSSIQQPSTTTNPPSNSSEGLALQQDLNSQEPR